EIRSVMAGGPWRGIRRGRPRYLRRPPERDPARRAGIVQRFDYGGNAGRRINPRRIHITGREPAGAADARLSAAYGALTTDVSFVGPAHLVLLAKPNRSSGGTGM